MNVILVLLAVLTVVMLVIVIMLLSRKKQEDVSSKIDASLKAQFLDFQTSIHKELSSTRDQVERSKDILSANTIKTLQQIGDMQKIIQQIIQQQEEAHRLGQSLKDILQVPKLRGNYGETVLEELLDRVLPKGIWERKYSIEGSEQVDAIVRFKDVIIPIDSKFPREDYRKYLDTTDPGEKSRCWKSYEGAVKLQIKNIATKYIKPEKGTADFALMFIPSDAIYYETIADKNYLGESSKIYEFAQENRVVPVSPNTFYAFLQIVITGIRHLEIIKSAKTLHENLSTIQKSFEHFFSNFEEIGRHLDKAAEAYRKGEKHVQTYKKKLDSTLQLEEFGTDVRQLPDADNS
ncbi:DNA recombination protein RmuC [candidate division WOR-3 bacterium]|nr:DNA recombination protein RmuC [candidate division WOR-3 bacterium]